MFWKDLYGMNQIRLGEEILDTLDDAKSKISSNPKAYQFRYKRRVRAFVLDRFPYLILYIVNKSNIDVISVFNTNKNPEILKERI